MAASTFEAANLKLACRQTRKKDDRSGFCWISPKCHWLQRLHGRSRGGLTMKIPALVEAEGLPIACKLTEALPNGGTVRARPQANPRIEGNRGRASRMFSAHAVKPRQFRFIDRDPCVRVLLRLAREEAIPCHIP
jgi:hypothetical protein